MTLLVCFAGAMTAVFTYAWPREAEVVATARSSRLAPGQAALPPVRSSESTASSDAQDPVAESTGELPLPAEDRALRAAPNDRIEVGPSPAPPRAPVEPEASGPDDPRDFEIGNVRAVETLRAD